MVPVHALPSKFESCGGLEDDEQAVVPRKQAAAIDAAAALAHNPIV